MTTKSAPEKIWLQIGDEHEGEYSDEATWCVDHIYQTDIAYVRADLHDAEVAELKRLLAIALKAMEDAQKVFIVLSRHHNLEANSSSINNAIKAIKEAGK